MNFFRLLMQLLCHSSLWGSEWTAMFIAVSRWNVATPSHLQLSGIKIVCTMAALYFLQPLNSSLLPFTFSCSHSTSPFLCQTLGMLHEQIFSIFYTSLVSCLLLFLSVCFIHFASVWMCALSILYSEHVCNCDKWLHLEISNWLPFSP